MILRTCQVWALITCADKGFVEGLDSNAGEVPAVLRLLSAEMLSMLPSKELETFRRFEQISSFPGSLRSLFSLLSFPSLLCGSGGVLAL
jgi:hypothetical protein